MRKFEWIEVMMEVEAKRREEKAREILIFFPAAF